jgi:hypothetical protein
MAHGEQAIAALIIRHLVGSALAGAEVRDVRALDARRVELLRKAVVFMLLRERIIDARLDGASAPERRGYLEREREESDRYRSVDQKVPAKRVVCLCVSHRIIIAYMGLKREWQRFLVISPNNPSWSGNGLEGVDFSVYCGIQAALFTHVTVFPGVWPMSMQGLVLVVSIRKRSGEIQKIGFMLDGLSSIQSTFRSLSSHPEVPDKRFAIVLSAPELGEEEYVVVLCNDHREVVEHSTQICLPLEASRVQCFEFRNPLDREEVIFTRPPVVLMAPAV